MTEVATSPDAFVVAGEAVPRTKRAEDEPWDLHLAELVNYDLGKPTS